MEQLTANTAGGSIAGFTLSGGPMSKQPTSDNLADQENSVRTDSVKAEWSLIYQIAERPASLHVTAALSESAAHVAQARFEAWMNQQRPFLPAPPEAGIPDDEWVRILNARIDFAMQVEPPAGFTNAGECLLNPGRLTIARSISKPV